MKCSTLFLRHPLHLQHTTDGVYYVICIHPISMSKLLPVAYLGFQKGGKLPLPSPLLPSPSYISNLFPSLGSRLHFDYILYMINFFRHKFGGGVASVKPPLTRALPKCYEQKLRRISLLLKTGFHVRKFIWDIFNNCNADQLTLATNSLSCRVMSLKWNLVLNDKQR